MGESLQKFYDNPFATRYTKPGAIPYMFADGESCSRIVHDFERSGLQGQIVGRHGSGKSTLLYAVAKQLAHRSYNVRHLRIQPKAKGRSLAAKHVFATNGQSTVSTCDSKNTRRVYLIDGFEQLNRIHRLLTIRWIAAQNSGVIVTTHRNTGLPTLFETRDHFGSFRRVVDWLQVGSGKSMPLELISDCYSTAKQNTREALFCLFDRYAEMERSKVFDTQI